MVIFYFCCHMTDANPAGLLSIQTQPPFPQCHQGEMRHTEEQNIVGKQSAVSWILWSPKSAQYCVNERELDVAFMQENMSNAKLQKQLWPLLHWNNFFLYIKRNSEWVRNGEREYGKKESHVSEQETDREGAPCRPEQLVQLSLSHYCTSSTIWNGFLQHTATPASWKPEGQPESIWVNSKITAPNFL